MNEMEIALLKFDCLRLADGVVSEAEKNFAFVSGSKPNAEALNVIRAMHTDLLAFRNPEFDLIASGREGDFDDRVKAVLAHSAPVISADRHASGSGRACRTGPAPDGCRNITKKTMKTDATPLLTQTDIEATIASEHYFTAADGDFAVNGQRPFALPDDPLVLLTFCVLVLRNGHTITGESFCADPVKFNADTGKAEARKVAIDKLWPMAVYAERERLAGIRCTDERMCAPCFTGQGDCETVKKSAAVLEHWTAVLEHWAADGEPGMGGTATAGDLIPGSAIGAEIQAKARCGMDFGAALDVLKAGGRAARSGWNGKGLWLELQVPDAKSKMTLPYVFINYPSDAPNTPGARVPWLASQTDMQADDWNQVE